MSRLPRLARFALLCGALGALPACAVPVESTSHVITGLAPLPTAPSSTSPTKQVVSAISYLLRNGRLFPVQRTAKDASPDGLLEALVQPPTSAQEKASIVNQLDLPGFSFHVAKPESKSGVLTVELPLAITNLVGTQAAEGFGQLVYTLLAPENNPGCRFTGVNFTLDGESWPAFLPSFVATTRTVNQKDYAAIAPRPARRTC